MKPERPPSWFLELYFGIFNFEERPIRKAPGLDGFYTLIDIFGFGVFFFLKYQKGSDFLIPHKIQFFLNFAILVIFLHFLNHSERLINFKKFLTSCKTIQANFLKF